MSIYNLDTDFVGENLMPPQLRTTKHLAWLKVILKPLNWFNTKFSLYRNGDPSSLISSEFIGVDERIIYSSQKMLFEYLLNRYFATTGIYIDNNFIGADNNFVMGASSSSSSSMPNNSAYSDTYMGEQPYYTTSQNDFTIYVPTAFYTGLGTYNEQLIRAVADKYVLAGITYNVTDY